MYDIPEWVWLIPKIVASPWDALHPEAVPELVDFAQASSRSAPHAYASIRRHLVVNTLTNVGSELL